MKFCSYLAVICSFLLPISGFSQIKVHLDPNADLLTSNKIKIGIVYKTKKGTTRKKGKLYDKPLSPTRYGLSIEGGHYDDYYKHIHLDRKVIKNQNDYLIIKYHHPRKKDQLIIDSILIPRPVDFRFEKAPVGYYNRHYPGAVIKMNNGNKTYASGKKLRRLLDQYGYTVSANNTLWDPSGYFQTEGYSKSIKNPELTIEGNGQKITTVFEFEPDFDCHLAFPPDPNSYNMNGIKVSVFIETIDSLNYKVRATADNGIEKVVTFDPRKSVISIINPGKVGKRGQNGADGSWEREGYQANPGQDGFQGGDGGDGGDIHIFYPRSFIPYLNRIICKNIGGLSGQGGYGGKGGRIDEEDPSLLNIIFPTRADSGNRGPEGRQGRAGRVDYHLID